MSTIKCNLNINSWPTIEKYHGTSHGISLVAMSMLDVNNRGLQFTVTIDGDRIDSYVEHVLSVWRRYNPIPSFIRSYKMDDKFMQEFDGIKLDTKPVFPSVPDMFMGKKVIIDIEHNTDRDEYTFKHYQWNEDKPRVLQLIGV